MTVNTLAFFLCFLASVVVYYLSPKKYQWMVLLAVSLVFYHLMGVDNFLYVLLTTVTLVISTGRIYAIDREAEKWLKNEKGSISREERKAYKARIKARKRRWLVWGVLVTNLGLLLVLKYGDFFIDNVNLLLAQFGMESVNRLGLIAPLGISYYTLQSIGYALEVYKGKAEPEKNPCKVLLFVTYYPQMTQGPIGRWLELSPQLFAGHSFSYQNLSYGCQRILWGVFKKAVIADNMKPMVDVIFDNYTDYSGFTLFMGCVYVVFQMYADFSGYTDIVAGMSEVYGIRMSENFARPLFANSLADYWRRWHISLSSWFRDYVFYPASISKGAVAFGKSGKKIFSPRVRRLFPAVFAMCIVWFCTGFWHDASWRYILWGVANGVVLISSLLLEPQFKWIKEKLHIPEASWWWQGFCVLRTFIIVALMKIFPAGASTADSGHIAWRIISDFHPEFTRAALIPELGLYKVYYIAAGLILFLIVSLIQEKKMPMREFLGTKPAAVRWMVYFILIGGILCLGAFDSTMAGGFEYAQF